MSARDWRERAACLDIDPELFFPATDIGPLCREQIQQAKAVCARCPVRTECLDFALSHLTEGVAGGLTASERCEVRAPAARERGGIAAVHRAGAPMAARSRATRTQRKTNPTTPLSAARVTEGA